MRSVTVGLSACTLLTISASSVAGQPEPQPPLREAALFTDPGIPDVAVPPLSDYEVTGVSRAARPELLTWERIYALALVRGRTRRGAFSPTLNPAALADESTRLGVADFARFRDDFRAGGSFRDPGPAVLELERRLLAIDSARRNVAVHENLSTLIVERSQEIASGLNRIDVDRVSVSLISARRKLAGEISQFRDGLDELKFLLGLSPRAPVVLERQNLSAFSAVFDSVESWATNSHRRIGELYRLIDRFPAPGDIVLNGAPILEKIEKNPDLWEELLLAAAQVAVRSRSERDEILVQPNSGVQLELQVRRRIRGLYDKRETFQAEKRSYELAIRLRDQAFERLLAPPATVLTSRSFLINELLEQLTQVFETQDRLVGLWTGFRAERLALYHDLAVLPYGDWKTFYTDLRPLPAGAGAMPGVEPKPGTGDTSRLTPPPVPRAP